MNPGMPETNSARRLAPLTACLLVAVVSGCAVREAPPVRPAGLPEDFPIERYERAAATGTAVYRIDPAGSLMTVIAGRDGPLARMGHDHVVASHDLAGYVLLDAGRIEADIIAPLDRLSVDDPELRAAAGFESDVPDDARRGTRTNMLASLDADRYPWVRLRAEAPLPREAGFDATIRVTVSLHGVSRDLDLPVRMRTEGNRVSAESQFTVRQSDFGVDAYSVLGGALRVKDELSVSVHLQASRL